MSKFGIALFVIIASTSLFGQSGTVVTRGHDYPDTVVYNAQSSLFLNEYVNRIDSLGYNDLLRRDIENDRRYILYRADYYSISDFLIFMMALNCYTPNRVEFVRSMLEKVEVTNTNVQSINCFIKDDLSCIQNLTQNNSSGRSSLLESVELSLFIRYNRPNMTSYNEFKRFADSVYHEFRKIPLTKDSIRLLLPMFEIFNIWNDQYPEQAKKQVLKFINQNKWAVLEPILMFEYINLLMTKAPVDNLKFKALAQSYPTIDMNLDLWRSDGSNW